MGNFIVLDIEIESIKEFLSKNLVTIDTDVASIFKQEESGKFTGIDDFSNALFSPLAREAIAIRAVFYELNALIEWELGNLATVAYHSARFKTPCVNSSSSDNVSLIRLVYDQPFNKICKLR